MRALLAAFLSLATLSAHAQGSTTPLKVPATALSQLEDLKELTKSEAAAAQPAGKKPGRQPAEVRPELNRWLVVGADDFMRVTAGQPTREAYLRCLEMGLARLAPLTPDLEDRQQVAEFYQELMDIVGLSSSEGRLAAFVQQAAPKAK